MTDFPPRSTAGLALPAGEVHLWSVPLDPPADRVEALRRHLSPDEQDRASRFRFDRHRRQYVVGRGALRALLGAYLGIRPEQVRFTYGPRGKPFLAEDLSGSLSPGTGERAGERGDGINLFFNLSNSHELALVGFMLGREIGVDVEHLKPMPDCEKISERFFSDSERKVLRGLPAERKEEAFFNCWTRKEAYLKAVGEGLAAPLDSFDVTLAPGEPPRMLTLRGDAGAAARWWFQHFEIAPDYIGALALERQSAAEEWVVRTWGFAG